MKRGEFELIADIRRRFGKTLRPVTGIGDDAAVIDGGLLVTTDAMVEGVHFIKDKIRFSDLGYKSIATNVSDIAAMGGEALYVLVTLGVSPGLTDAEADLYMDGLSEAAAKFGVDLIGGDVVRSAVLFVSVTAIGRAVGKPFLRSAAKAGDTIYVSGTLGDSALGLALETGGLKFPVADEAYFRARHYRPEPRLGLAKYLAEHCGVHACIDVSDGFAADLGHICEESGTGFAVELDKLPLSVQRIGGSIQVNPRYFYELAAAGGEDYELILTAGAGWDCEGIFRAAGVPVTAVGKIAASGGTFTFRGEPVELPVRGFTHI